MADVRLNLDREQQAHAELGQTMVSRSIAWLTVLAFLVSIALVPAIDLIQFFLNDDAPAQHPATALVHDWPTAQSLKAFETALEEESWLATQIRPYPNMLQAAYGSGVGDAILGRDGWLHYSPDVNHILGPGFLDPKTQRKREIDAADKVWPDPLACIKDFRDQLKQRNIKLIIVPIPNKTQMHPASLSGSVPAHGPALTNVSMQPFLKALQDEHIPVVDFSDRFTQEQDRASLYLNWDTHWSPHGLNLAADELAAAVREQIDAPERTDNTWSIQQVSISQPQFDLYGMLEEAAIVVGMNNRTVEINQVVGKRGELWRPTRNSRVLLLGDSYTNIYSMPGMTFGSSAGLAEQLSYRLGEPIDRIAVNDGGAYTSRSRLVRDLAAGRDRLAGVKVVVWTFATRELSFGNWQPMDLTVGQPPDDDVFISAQPGQPMEVTGTVAAVASLPDPKQVVYADQLIAVHLVDVTSQARKNEQPGEVLVYVFGMRAKQWTSAADLREGQTVRIRLYHAEDHPDMESVQPSDLSDDRLLLAPLNYGELIE